MGRSRPGIQLSVVLLIDEECSEDLLCNSVASLEQQARNYRRFHVYFLQVSPPGQNIARIIESLETGTDPRSVEYSVFRLRAEHTPLEARLALVGQLESDYLFFMIPGDVLDPDYLKKTALVLQATPDAEWVYTSHFSGGANRFYVRAPDFRPYSGFSLSRAAVYRRASWEAAASVVLKNSNDRFHRDHDLVLLIIRSRGGFGLPVRDTVMHLHTADSSEPTKTTLISQYLALRKYYPYLPLLVRSAKKFRLFCDEGFGYRSILSPAGWLDRIQRFVFRWLVGGRIKAVLEPRELLLALINPDRFVRNFQDPSRSMSLAEIACEFVSKPGPGKPCEGQTPGEGAIMFAQTNWVIGGAEEVLMNWMRDARRVTGARIIDICERDRYGEFDPRIKEMFAALSDEQYNLQRLSEIPRQRLDICWQLICETKPALIFISGNATMYALLPRIREKFRETTVVDILHNEWYIPGDWFDISYEYRRYIDRRIVVSDFWAKRLAESYEEFAERISVVYNSVDLARFDPEQYDRAILRRQMGLSADKTIVVYVGRLHEQKNPATFFEVARSMASDLNFHFIVVGDGVERESLLQEYGGLPNLTYYGASTSIERFLAVSDVTVFCSRFEGYPITSLESAAMNTPVIAPNIIGFREQLQSGGFGLLYEPTGEPLLDAERISDILLNRMGELASMSSKGRQYVSMGHDNSALGSRRENILNTFMGKSNKKKLFLHVGLAKTGTSTIQDFCYKNRHLLAANDLCYPEFSDGTAHHNFAWAFYRADSGQEYNLLYDAYGPKHEWLQHIEQYVRQLRLVEQNNILISSEAFIRGHADKVAGCFREFDTRVIVFLRRQDHILESRYNQKQKRGRLSHMNAEQFLEHMENTGQFDYLKTLEPWKKAFGRENIMVVPFEHDFYKDGVEKSLLNLLGIGWDERYEMVGSANPSLSRDCAEYLAYATVQHGMSEAENYHTIQLLEDYSLDNPGCIKYNRAYSPSVRIGLLEKYEQSNSEVAKQYLDRADGRLFREKPPSADEEWETYPGLDEETTANIAAYIEKYRPPA